VKEVDKKRRKDPRITSAFLLPAAETKPAEKPSFWDRFKRKDK
jgi:hypothetical protein